MSWNIVSTGKGSNLSYSQAGTPSLDLRFAETKALTDYTTGQNLVTFSRASGGTYVDSQGVIRNAVTNLLLRSEEFNNASWIGIGSVVSADAIASPSGAVTSDLLRENASNSIHEIYQFGTGGASTYTLSVFFKNGTGTRHLNLGASRGSSDWISCRFNLVNGTASAVSIEGSSFTSASAQIASRGDGWYRGILTFTSSGSFSTQIALSSSSAAPASGSYGVETYQGDNASGIYLWGAQLEQSSTVGEYVPTGATINSAPRFDHDPTTGESLGLLVEEQRTNLCLQSENLGTTWTAAAVSVTANQRTAPDGTLSMDTVTATGGAGFLQQAITVTNSTVYTASVYVYAASNRTRLIIHNGASDICNIAWTSISGNTTSVSGTASGIAATHVGSSIYRLSFTFTSTSTTANFRIQPLDGSGNAVSGATGDFWGAQLEAGAFPTSYIPTTASAVTRAADVASISGSNFSSWYRQAEGTFVLRYDAASSGGRPFSASNAGATERLEQRIISSYRMSAAVIGGTPYSAYSDFAQVLVPGVAWSHATSQDGSILTTAGPVGSQEIAIPSAPVVDSLAIGSFQGTGTYLNGRIRRLTYWPQRLPNATLQALTQ